MRNTILWAAMIFAASAVGAEQRVEVNRVVDANVEISIESIAGSLTIIGTDTNELRVTGTLGDDVEELEIRGDASELSIEVEIPDKDDWRGKRKIEANLEIHLPRGARLEVETVSSSIEISGVSGRIEAGSVSGKVALTGGVGGVEAESISGEIWVSGGANVSAESVSGKIVLAAVSGDLEATTVSGNIRIEAGPTREVEIETVAGDVFFKGRPGRSLEIESHSGNVELLLPADLSAEFELSSFSGRIDNDLGPEATRTDRYEPGVSAEFRTGSGDAEVSVETFSGNIALKSF